LSCESCHELQTHYLVTLKFGTEKGGIRVHLGTNGIWLILAQSYLQLFTKIIPICCHVHRLNLTWQEAENWYKGKLVIHPQTFCGLKKIEQKTMDKDTVKNTTVCNDYAIDNY